MTYEMFWYDNIELFEIYANAYNEKTRYEAWLHGNFVNIAVTTALNNAFTDKKENRMSYPLYDEITTYSEKEAIVRENKTKGYKQKPEGNNDYDFLSQCY